MLEHLEEGKGGDVDLLRRVEERGVRRRVVHAAGAGENSVQSLHRSIDQITGRNQLELSEREREFLFLLLKGINMGMGLALYKPKRDPIQPKILKFV